MAKKSKSKELDFDFIVEMEKLQEAKNLELLTEGITLYEPSGLAAGIDEPAWVKLQGATPLEFLSMVYKNPFNTMSERINAAKSILDFVHRKLPQKIEVDGTMNDTRKITTDALSKLSDDELSTFTRLLEKMGQG